MNTDSPPSLEGLKRSEAIVAEAKGWCAGLRRQGTKTVGASSAEFYIDELITLIEQTDAIALARLQLSLPTGGGEPPQFDQWRVDNEDGTADVYVVPAKEMAFIAERCQADHAAYVGECPACHAKLPSLYPAPQAGGVEKIDSAVGIAPAELPSRGLDQADREPSGLSQELLATLKRIAFGGVGETGRFLSAEECRTVAFTAISKAGASA